MLFNPQFEGELQGNIILHSFQCSLNNFPGKNREMHESENQLKYGRKYSPGISQGVG
jgi:hypothetical protein